MPSLPKRRGGPSMARFDSELIPLMATPIELLDNWVVNRRVGNSLCKVSRAAIDVGVPRPRIGTGRRCPSQGWPLTIWCQCHQWRCRRRCGNGSGLSRPRAQSLQRPCVSIQHPGLRGCCGYKCVLVCCVGPCTWWWLWGRRGANGGACISEAAGCSTGHRIRMLVCSVSCEQKNAQVGHT